MHAEFKLRELPAEASRIVYYLAGDVLQGLLPVVACRTCSHFVFKRNHGLCLQTLGHSFGTHRAVADISRNCVPAIQKKQFSMPKALLHLSLQSSYSKDERIFCTLAVVKLHRLIFDIP